MHYSSIVFRRSFERWCFRQYFFHSTIYIKCILCLIIIYLLNVILGVQYYVWSEKSFENEYHLVMTRIDLGQLDQDHPEKSLGSPTNILPNTFLIPNQDLCRDSKAQTVIQPHLLILVKSAVENWQARQAIRMTWAKRSFLEANNIKLAFVLGASEDHRSVEQESRQYEDIIQIDKIDFYYHNSYKMVMMLRWISDYCISPSSDDDLRNYVLFVDDDYYINLNSLLTYIKKVDVDSSMTMKERRTLITGYVYEGSRPRRFLNDRWYISINDYPYDRYPPYVTAGCFLMTRSNARLFYLASKYTRLFRFDDIYMGLLAYSMSIRITPNNNLFSSYGSSTNLFRNQTGFFSKWKTFFTNEENSNSTIQPICIHGYRGEELIHIWNDLHRTNLTLTKVI